MTNILFFSTRWFVSCLPFRYAWLPQIPRYLDQVFSQIEVGREKSTIYDKYRKPNFPREIQAIKLDECNATKLPFGCFVRQSGQREHSPEGNLTDGKEVKLPRDCAPKGLTATPNCLQAVLVALVECYLLAWISQGQFGFLCEVYIQSRGQAREGETCVWCIFIGPRSDHSLPMSVTH